jgi:carbon monoxide dehydrogenase subunit G
MKVERRTEIGAPPESVYEVVMDPRRLDEWVTIHDHLVEAPEGGLRQGSELIQCLKLAGRRFNVHWEVVEADRPNRVVWDGKGPVHSRAQVVYELQRNGDEGTKFSYTNEYDLPGGALGNLAGRALSRATGKALDSSLEKLKSLFG